MELTPEELDELLGAYALDALDPNEREAVEAHLAASPRARDEVARLDDVVAALANTGGDAPASLWANISAAIDATPIAPHADAAGTGLSFEPMGGEVREITSARSRPMRRTIVAGIAAVAAVVIAFAVMSVALVHQGNELNAIRAEQRTPNLSEQAAAALADPNASITTLVAANGKVAARAVVDHDGHGYLVSSDLAALASGTTYQLWGVVDGQAISLGVLGRDPKAVSFSATSAAQTLALTVEKDPGVVASKHAPVASGNVA
jgi:anti-sigma factor RsiW